MAGEKINQWMQTQKGINQDLIDIRHDPNKAGAMTRAWGSPSGIFVYLQTHKRGKGR
ncbi:MAG: hypothetical protein Ta2B_10420 [Termitinemataceae bacterium]|nr:MAG: hypothetical protein Ta2B_10420 [Termitinemataceae bacterium]